MEGWGWGMRFNSMALLVNHQPACPWACVGQQPRLKAQEGWDGALLCPPSLPPVGPEVKVFIPASPS